jgi:hypothetical protein
MIDTKPSAVLLRVLHLVQGEARSSITLDTSGDLKTQRELRNNLHAIAEPMANTYGMRLPPNAEIEILTGITANRIERQDDLLNRCRNLLIDTEDRLTEGSSVHSEVQDMLGELDAELGL